jgi:hypothetical protein
MVAAYGVADVDRKLTAQLHIVPLTLGAGTRLFEGVPPVILEQVRSRAATSVTHLTYGVLS